MERGRDLIRGADEGRDRRRDERRRRLRRQRIGALVLVAIVAGVIVGIAVARFAGDDSTSQSAAASTEETTELASAGPGARDASVAASSGEEAATTKSKKRKKKPSAPAAGAATAATTEKAGAASSTEKAATGAPEERAAAAASTQDLARFVVHLDPGHNPGNAAHSSEVNREVDYGEGTKPCDTTGTSTPSGYTEAEYNLDVVRRVRSLLEQRGAEVVVTPVAARPWGPCITERAALGNEVNADAAVSIHANGSASASTRGYFVIAPSDPIPAVGLTQAMIDRDVALGEALLATYGRATGLDQAYAGGFLRSNAYAGTNLAKVPKVFIETGHMSNPVEAALLETEEFRARAAHGIADGIARFLLASR